MRLGEAVAVVGGAALTVYAVRELSKAYMAPASPSPSDKKKKLPSDEEEEEEDTPFILGRGRVEFPNSRPQAQASQWCRVAPIPPMPPGTRVELADDNGVRAALEKEGAEGNLALADAALEEREATMRGIVRHFLKTMHLPRPSVLISIYGGAGVLDITREQMAVFRHGLLDAVRQTSACGDKSTAWIVTGGTDSGVMQLTGKTMHGLDEEITIPLIGVAAWGVVSQRSHMATGGAVAARDPAGTHRVRTAGSYLYGSKADPPSQVQRAIIGLEPNHSNFVFVDNGKEGSEAFYAESDVRATLEDFIARGAPDGPGRSLFGVDEDGDKFPPPPMLLLVVGGGPGAFGATLQSLQIRRPVVILSDSGGAAQDIYDYCVNGGLNMSIERKYAGGADTAMKYLPAIKALWETTTLRRAKMLTFFALFKDFTEDSDTEDFSTHILNAIVSDCEKGLVVTLNAYKAGRQAGCQLWFAASVGNTDAMTRLLAQGVPPDEYRDEHERTALNVAAYNGKLDAVKILVEAGADVNAIQNGGHTVLQCAVEPEQGGPEQALKDSRSLDVVNVLIAAGADPSIVDWNGSTALIEARDSASSGPQRAAIVAALEKAVSDLASDATA